ncbi:hypothetical protein [Pseudoponticoccus marisrubri]|uniref:D-galactarate dehydratase n=1 Tax=Pseudoponticoccus marisrubri TaxID=1685382 RepID=A0A0W7WEW6_9RHOB|nr:hypothetical protein [Pseudoponticoccus marisrubri]KUF09117.1 hypothetical protein AVJ23_19530 [Pseudoponticoccus marisrubri]
MRAVWAITVVLGVAACGSAPFEAIAPDRGAKAAPAAATGQTRPQARPESLSTAPAPNPAARTADEFDTTSDEERAAAAAAPAEPAGERKLGETVASLGDPARPGFWLETPLVSAPAKGRVVYPATGKSAQVDLIPIDGPATAGSRISLAAMRLIEAPLTDLPTLEVYTGG